ncbi:winged helix-turn-helix domain-containing protein [Ideonella livida]|uniref:Winged helix-turn-helix domain-containing protein n=1 Tax=Ideonella livida TaxID=2707176 RepID=A0A7C9TM45_9BURK|nr:winged helix-turn-helix domain-containing protein [Ideonella livida]NDY93638.1 winged helix-turn-helix domain-containing protein [Ideonella livida]
MTLYRAGAVRHHLPVAPEGRALTLAQERHLRERLLTTTPAGCGLAPGLWTRASLCQLVQQETGVQLAAAAVARYQERWGLRPRVARGLLPQDQHRLFQRLGRSQLEMEGLKVRHRAHSQGAELHLGAVLPLPEATAPALQELGPWPTGPGGQWPTLLASVSGQGRMSWLPVGQSRNALAWVPFLRGLAWESQRSCRKVLLLLTVNPWEDEGQALEPWLEELQADLELYLPAQPAPQAVDWGGLVRGPVEALLG